MTRHRKSPLRLLTSEERKILKQVSRAGSTPAAQVERAKLLLAVADGKNYTQAAQSVGRRSGDAVSHLVQRFNVEGLEALVPHHGGGFCTQYGNAERARILQEFQRTPDRQRDGTATWSLTTLQRALRRAPDGLPQVSTATLLTVLHEAGYRWQRTGSWCETGVVLRKRKQGLVEVTDPEAEAKKS